jgi:hypothetical protein
VVKDDIRKTKMAPSPSARPSFATGFTKTRSNYILSRQALAQGAGEVMRLE